MQVRGEIEIFKRVIDEHVNLIGDKAVTSPISSVLEEDLFPPGTVLEALQVENEVRWEAEELHLLCRVSELLAAGAVPQTASVLPTVQKFDGSRLRQKRKRECVNERIYHSLCRDSVAVKRSKHTESGMRLSSSSRRSFTLSCSTANCTPLNYAIASSATSNGTCISVCSHPNPTTSIPRIVPPRLPHPRALR